MSEVINNDFKLHEFNFFYLNFNANFLKFN